MDESVVLREGDYVWMRVKVRDVDPQTCAVEVKVLRGDENTAGLAMSNPYGRVVDDHFIEVITKMRADVGRHDPDGWDGIVILHKKHRLAWSPRRTEPDGD